MLWQSHVTQEYHFEGLDSEISILQVATSLWLWIVTKLDIGSWHRLEMANAMARIEEVGQDKVDMEVCHRHHPLRGGWCHEQTVSGTSSVRICSLSLGLPSFLHIITSLHKPHVVLLYSYDSWFSYRWLIVHRMCHEPEQDFVTIGNNSKTLRFSLAKITNTTQENF